MNVNTLDEVLRNLKCIQNQGVITDNRQKEYFWMMARDVRMITAEMEAYQQAFNKFANMADECKDQNLADAFKKASRGFNPELEYLAEIAKTMKAIAES